MRDAFNNGHVTATIVELELVYLATTIAGVWFP